MSSIVIWSVWIIIAEIKRVWIIVVVRIGIVIWIIVIIRRSDVTRVDDTAGACYQETHYKDYDKPFFHDFLLQAIRRLPSIFLPLPSSNRPLSS